MSNFTPISIIPMRNEAWRTPDFNPQIADKNFWKQIADSGISVQSQKQLLDLQRQLQPPKTDIMPMGVGGVQKDPRATIQLPNGQFVTPEQYQQLLLKLKQRG